MKKFILSLAFFAPTILIQAQCVESFPYTQDFESADFALPPTNQGPGTIPSCWSRTHLSAFYWRPESGVTSTINTGPLSDHTTGAGKYMVLEADFSGTNMNTGLITNYIDLSNATSPELRFWRHMFGFQISNLSVQVQRFGQTSWSSLGSYGSQQTVQTDPWTETVSSLSTYAGDTIRLRFLGARPNGFSTSIQAAIDDITIAELTTCTTPNSFTVQSKTQTSVTLTWQTVNTTPSAEIRYVQANQPLSNATVVNASTSNPFTVTGLLPSTTYLFWVRDSCQNGQYSPWVGPLVETTTCGTITAPWFEGFESVEWQLQSGFNDPGAINPCWNRNPTSGYIFLPGPMAFPSTISGPASAHSGSKYVRADRAGFSTNNAPILRSPRIDLSSLTTPELSFYYYMYGTNISKLEVEVISVPGGSWSVVRTITGQQQSSQSDPWIEEVIDLSAYANSEIFIRFKAYHSGTNFNAAIALDDIKVEEAPPCPRPNPFSVLATTATTASFNFTSSGTAPWQIEYGPAGFTQGNGTLVTVNSNPATITGLTAQTTYDFYIRDTCGALGVSTWTGPVTATTDCNPVSAPYVENFDGSSWTGSTTFATQGTLNGCWSASDDQTHLFWTPSPPAFNLTTSGPQGDHTTGSGDYVYIDAGFFVAARDTAVLETPLIDLTALTVPEVTFWYHMFGANISSLKVYVFDGTSWTQEFVLNGQQQSGRSDLWKEGLINLSAYANDTIKLRFVGKRSATTGNTCRMAIDDVDVHEQPLCPKPTQITLSNPTTTSFQVSWNTSGGSAWLVEYGPAGFTPGSGTVSSATASPYTINGLLPGTLYDVYVYNDCAPNDTSDPAGPKSLATVCGAINAPFIETFDGPGWVVPTGFTDPGELEPCWIRTDTVNYVWKPEDKQTFPLTTGPAADHTTGFGKYMYADQVFGTNTLTRLRSPEINLTPLDTPELRFWYYMYGADISILSVQVNDGSGWSTVSSFNGQQQSSATGSWLEAVVDLSSYANQTIFLRFSASRPTTGFNADIAIDDIRIDERPNCPGPSDVTAQGVSESAVEVSWTSGGGTSWIIEYGPTGFTPGSGTTVTALNNPFIVNGLNTNTAYDFYVSDSCANGGVSWSQGPANGVTYPCAGACLYKLKLEDQFTNGWSITPGNATYHWVDIIVNGVARSYTIRSGGVENFDIPICDGSYYEVRFRDGGFGSIQCGIEFRDPSGALLYDRNFGVSNLAAGQLFADTGSCSPVCDDPVGLTIQSIGPAGATAFWSSLSGTSQIAWGPSGFTPGTPGQTGITTGNYAISGLNPGTTYDVYIRDTCSNGLLSGWVGPVSFTTLNCSTPTASFTWTSAGLQGNFDASGSSANAVTFTWQFGDGNTGFATNVGHTYTTAGIYTVNLIVANACGDTDTTSQQIVICGAPSAAFTTNKIGLNANFDASASAGIGNQYNWNYGDGNNGTGVTSAHSYTAPGNYDVTLIVTDTCGTTDTIIQNITVCSTPTASFTWTGTGNTINFDASSSTNASQYVWDFGNGSTGTGVTTSNTYGVSQNYNVILYVINACGDTVSDTQVVALCSDPVASWTYQIISSGGSGMLVQFDGTASVGTSFFWSFGDGSTATGTNFPTHTYATPGLFYRVELIVGNNCGDTDTLAYKLSAIGLEEQDLERASVHPNPTTGNITIETLEGFDEPLQVQLFSLSGSEILNLDWDATDGRHMNIQIPEAVSHGTYILRVVYRESVQNERIIYRP